MIFNCVYRYRIFPNNEQQDKLIRQFGAARFVYNYFLRQRIDTYANTNKNLTYYDTSLLLTELKKQSEHVWLKDVNAQSLQQILTDLDRAYNNFFNKRANFPIFKRKHDKQSCRYPQFFKLTGKKLYIPKIGWVNITIHRPIKGKIKNLTISKTKSGKYFASLLVEQEIADPIFQGNQIGLDLGLKDFVVTSDDQRFPAPKFFRKSEKKLAKLQQRLSKTEIGSANRNKARIKVARQHEKIANQRKDFLHKLSRQLVEDNQLIVIEDLNVKGMVRNHKLAKSINDAGWSEFIRQLQYKGLWYGCEVVKIDRFFPSTKRCFNCGFINQNLTLNDREWTCPECKSLIDRDVNAAKNILNWYTVGTTEINASGENVRPNRAISLKEEAS